MNWILMPVVNGLRYTLQAAEDLLAQTGVEPRLLIVNNGGDDEIRRALEDLAMQDARVYVWSHDPPLPSLSATWNRGLEFIWRAGGREALVVNNDIRVDPWTYQHLLGCLRGAEALFVSAVGWNEPRWMDTMFKDREAHIDQSWRTLLHQKGGPDFSCFLISQACHWKYPFDEGFIPAYCEDVDYHRRLMLGGDGARIFSVNLPYLHYASRTLNEATPEQQVKWRQRIERSRAHYRRKWGGDVNYETFLEPFGPAIITGVGDRGVCHVTTPDLQVHGCTGWKEAPVDAPAE